MLLRRFLAWMLVLLVGGPVVYQWSDPDGGTRQGFDPVIERSMAPDFSSSSEPTYPIVLFHQHRFPTNDEERNERWWPTRVVCYALDEVTLRDSESAAKASAPCMPLVEVGIGWLHTSSEGFGERSRHGVVASLGCDTTLLFADAQEHMAVASAEGWKPRIGFLPNGSVAIDDTWFLRPGQALKVEYVLVGREFGDSDDRRVRVAIDFPGRWLVRNTGAMPYDEISGETLRHAPPEARNEFGEIVANVPVDANAVEGILGPLLAPAGSQQRLMAFRATVFDGRLTDVSVTLSSQEHSVEWYVGGRDAMHIRMLGRIVPHIEGGIETLEFQDAFDDPLSTYTMSLTDSLPVVVWWAPDHAFQTTSIVPWSETWVPPNGPCGAECGFVWSAGPTGGKDWRRHPGPVVEGEDALTIAVEAVTTDDVRRAYFHRPG